MTRMSVPISDLKGESCVTLRGCSATKGKGGTAPKTWPFSTALQNLIFKSVFNGVFTFITQRTKTWKKCGNAPTPLHPLAPTPLHSPVMRSGMIGQGHHNASRVFDNLLTVSYCAAGFAINFYISIYLCQAEEDIPMGVKRRRIYPWA